jgi:cell division protein FtsZ
MKNGGVAILGKAEVEGENRAQRAIEEALNSPLLNDNDIKGAKWILLNINSAEGDFECSMDELETISTILRERTGEHSDVIMGSGYDDTLGEKIGITLIATGFEGKNPFKKEEVKKEELPTEEKIVMTLAPEAPAQVETPAATNEASIQNTLVEETAVPEEENNQFVLSLEEEAPVHFSFDVEETVQNADLIVEAAENIDQSHLAPSLVIETPEVSNVFVETPALDTFESTSFEEEVFEEEAFEEEVYEEEATEELVFQLDMETPAEEPTYNFSAETTEFVLSKPTNIYAEETAATSDVNAVEAVEEVNETIVAETVAPVAEVQVEAAPEEVFESSFRVVLEEEPAMQLVVREQDFENSNSQSKSSAKNFEMPIDDSEEQRRKVRERIQKLRNLSFNVGNGNDPSAEFDEVPAYVRRNMDLFGNTLASVENYYSKYTVDQDENNQTQISTINTFLDGKKPD